MGEGGKQGTLETLSTTLRPPLAEEDDKTSKNKWHLQKAQDARDMDRLIALVFGEEGAKPTTLYSKFSKEKSML